MLSSPHSPTSRSGSRRRFFGGNWKMNLRRASAAGLASEVAVQAAKAGLDHRHDLAVFPPFPYLLPAAEALRAAADGGRETGGAGGSGAGGSGGSGGSRILLGAQDFYPEGDGAFTGEVSLGMLADCHCRAVLVGHSERRHILREPDDLIARKAHSAAGAGFVTVLCIGETLAQREAGQTDAVNEQQLRSALSPLPTGAGGGTGDVSASAAAAVPFTPENLVIAYEPVWAIGTGKNATPEDAQDAHRKIRDVLATILGPDAAHAIRIIYGGSLKPSNAAALLGQPDVDGGLIGGASLKAEEFLAIAGA